MASSHPDVTILLGLVGQGDKQAQDALFRLVEGELRSRAKACLRSRRPRHDLQTTMLVHDAFMRLVGDPNLNWEDRAHFYCYAAKVMHNIAVDVARAHVAAKRGGGEQNVPL